MPAPQGTVITDEIEVEIVGEPDTTVPLPAFIPAVQPTLDVPLLPNAKKVTRAELIKIAMNTHYGIMDMRTCFLDLSPSSYWLLFADVPVGADYGVQLCTAMQLGSVDGYANGMFQPDKEVNLAEASKMLAQAFGLDVQLKGSEKLLWYVPYVNALQAEGVNMYSHGKMSDTVSYEKIIKIVDSLQRSSLQ